MLRSRFTSRWLQERKMATTWVVLALETAGGMAVASAAVAWLRARIITERAAVVTADALGND